MKLYQMNCRSCNAPLEIDLEKLQAYCPYCGSRLMFDAEQLQQILQTRIREEGRTERVKVFADMINERIHAKADKQRMTEETTRELLKAIPWICAAVIVLCGLLILMFYLLLQILG